MRTRIASSLFCLHFSIFANDVCLAETAVLEPPVATAPATVCPAQREGNDWWQGRHAAMNKRVAKGNVDLLMIGDSITQGWEGHGKDIWAEYYAKRNAVNLGISGDRTEHVLWRLQNGNIENISPKLAVIMIGTNNAGSNTSEEIAQGVEKIVGLLRRELPEMKLLVLAIFPRGETPSDKHRLINDGANERIEKLANGKMIHYLNIEQAFLEEDGTLPKEIMPDFLHPRKKGYAIWASAMETKIVELLK